MPDGYLDSLQADGWVDMLRGRIARSDLTVSSSS